MRTWQGLGGLLNTITDTNLRQALSRLDADAHEKSAAITTLSKNKSADAAQVVVARAVAPEASNQVSGTEIVNAFKASRPLSVGSIVEQFDNVPTAGNFIIYAFVREIANGNQPFTLDFEYGYAGATESVRVIDDTLFVGGILTGSVPIFSDGTIPFAFGVTTTAGVEYDLQLNVVAV